MFLSTKNDSDDAEPEGAEDAKNPFFEPVNAEDRDRGVEDHKIQPHLGRAGGQIGDLELIGCPEGQERVNHQAAHPQRHEPHQLVIDPVKQKRPADEDRTHEHKVQKVVHVKAPLDEALIACPADGAVKAVGKPLHKDHQRRKPQPVRVIGPSGEHAKADHP